MTTKSFFEMIRDLLGMGAPSVKKNKSSRADINLSGSMVVINGRSYQGENIKVVGNNVFIDNVLIEGEDEDKLLPISITIEGDCDNVSVASGTIHVRGDANTVSNVSGSIEVTGDSHHTKTVSGSITVSGSCENAQTVSGAISAQRFKNTKSVSGKIRN